MKKRLIIHNHYARDAEPRFYLWGRSKDGGTWARINPASLSFATKAEGETVKARYERTYPDQKFTVAADINAAKDSKPARDGAAHVTPLGQVNGLPIYDFHDYGQNRFQVFRSKTGPVLAGFPGRDAAMNFARTYKTNDAGVRIVHNRLLGGWYVVTGPHQTPISGKFNSEAEAKEWLRTSREPAGTKPPGSRDVSYQYHEGVKAAASGEPQSACPYPAGSNPASQWKAGFNAPR